MAEKKKHSEKVDKRYRAKITVAGQVVYISAKTKSELERKKVETRRHLVEGYTQKSDITFYQYLLDWWTNDKLPHITKIKTISAYKSVLNNQILPNINKKQLLRAVTRRDLQNILNASTGASSSTIAVVKMFLKSLCKQAVIDGLMEHDISSALVTPTAKKAKERSSLTDEQRERFLDACAKCGKAGLFGYVLYYLGLRRGEALGLRWGDFDFKERTVDIERQLLVGVKIESTYELADLKSDAGRRTLPVPTPLLNVLREYKQHPNAFVFVRDDGKPYAFYDSQNDWEKIMLTAGMARHIEGTYRVATDFTPHWLRHTYITTMYDAEIPAQIAQRIAGHARYATTLNVYTHIKDERVRREAAKLEDIFSQPKIKKIK